MKKIITLFIILGCLVIISGNIFANTETPVEKHGKIRVEGTNIVDQNGNKFQLRGISTHGIAWFPQYVNQDAFNYMRDEWKINTIRLAMYSAPEAGYTNEIKEKVKQGIEYAKNAGLYVIVDWHILSDGNPNIYKSSAIEFFKEIATLYKNDANIIYEICNEPNGNVEWERDIKPYAEEVIKEIRNIDKDSIIIVGTPTWSQDVDVVAQSLITGYSNIMYTLHFYAATHKEYLRNKMQTALNSGLPIFVTEFGICDASGNGNIDEEEANIWIDELNKNNISWVCWNLSNKNESSAILTENTNKVTGWTNDELSQSGKWLVNKLKSYPEDKTPVNTNNEVKSQTSNTTNNEEVKKAENKKDTKYDILITALPSVIAIMIVIAVMLNKKRKK